MTQRTGHYADVAEPAGRHDRIHNPVSTNGIRLSQVHNPGDYVGRHRLSTSWRWHWVMRNGSGQTFRVNLHGGAFA